MPANKHRAAKLVVKDNDNHEYYVIANPGMANKWRKDKTIPLVDVVQCKPAQKGHPRLTGREGRITDNVRLCAHMYSAFDVWTSTCHKETGEAIRPPKGMLE